VLPLCFSAFLAFGAVLVLLGANQASLAAELGLDLAQSGLLASALALGLGAGVVIAGRCSIAIRGGRCSSRRRCSPRSR
jgi:MFS family permease